MNRLLKITIVLFVVIIGLIAAWFSLDKTIRCKLIYGKNICNFYAMMDIANYSPLVSDFDKMMNLCKEMTDVPKKDSCFEYIAATFGLIDMNKAEEACNEIKGFDGVHSKEDCHIKIQKITKLKLAESAIAEFMEVRIARNEERALTWLTDNAKGQYLLRSDVPLVGLSNPHLADFKILTIELLDFAQFKFKVRLYEAYTGEGIIGYFDEILIVIKKDGKYMIDSLVERSEFINL